MLKSRELRVGFVSATSMLDARGPQVYFYTTIARRGQMTHATRQKIWREIQPRSMLFVPSPRVDARQSEMNECRTYVAWMDVLCP